jgi:hypothetical protein
MKSIGFESAFEHDEITQELCPEAQGHICILWGEHGHGGYNSQVRGYIQGGQPMDDTFELMGLYIDFEDARAANDWLQMRQVVSELKQQRAEMKLSKDEERALRNEA